MPFVFPYERKAAEKAEPTSEKTEEPKKKKAKRVSSPFPAVQQANALIWIGAGRAKESLLRKILKMDGKGYSDGAIRATIYTLTASGRVESINGVLIFKNKTFWGMKDLSEGCGAAKDYVNSKLTKLLKKK